MGWHSEIKQFTEESTGKKIPKSPNPASSEDVKFIVRMVMSELAELVAATVTAEETSIFMQECLGSIDPPKVTQQHDSIALMAEQYDAIGDLIYYCYNWAGKHGCDLDGLLKVIHDANLRKKVDGKYLIRESDGKVLKPSGWTPPDIQAEIKRQLK